MWYDFQCTLLDSLLRDTVTSVSFSWVRATFDSQRRYYTKSFDKDKTRYEFAFRAIFSTPALKDAELASSNIN